MKIEVSRSKDNGKWLFVIDDKVITEQGTLTKMLTKALKYIKSQGL